MNMHTQIVVNAPASEAWRVLGQQFGTIGDWSTAIRKSTLAGDLGVGAVRSCHGNGFGPFPPGEVSERLTSFDSEAMTFTYAAVSGLPWFILRAQNAWSIKTLGPARCCVRSHATVEFVWWLRPLGRLLPWLTRRDTGLFTEELKHQSSRADPIRERSPL